MNRSVTRGVVFLVLAAATTAWGQGNNNNNNNNNNGQQIAGIAVDATGVLRMHLFTDRGGAVARERIAAARVELGDTLTRSSKLRKVSLTRLEAAIRDRLDRSEKLTNEMEYLAGLTKVQYVFFYPDSGDVVLAGPAEGWAADVSGRVRGFESGKPVLQLQDLVVALRAFPPAGKPTSTITCSIDPTQEGLANMQEFLRRVGRNISPGSTGQIAQGLRQSLGMQKITIRGIPGNTHFANVLVEADYRMKLIGIGLERPRTRIKSYVDYASPASVARNAMQRWYFVPEYECVRMSEDELAMELVGDSVKLVGEDEVVAQDGSRVAAARIDAAGRKFVEGFTAHYAELARETPVYAELRNLIDLAVAAAFIQQQDYYGKAGWELATLGDETVWSVQHGAAAEQVEPAVATYVRGNTVMTPIGGGVRIEARTALSTEYRRTDDTGEVAKARAAVTLDSLKPDQWWWD